MTTSHTVSRHRLFVSFSFIFVISCVFPYPAAGQNKREHLTAQEIEVVRDSQELDKRTLVFIKAAERRVSLLTNAQAAPPKEAQKEIEKWGDISQSTRTQLLSDLARIFDEAITNIDDAALRSADSPLLSKSLKQLSAASTNFLTQLAPLRDRAGEGAEREALEQTLDALEEIIEAAKKVPDVKGEK